MKNKIKIISQIVAKVVEEEEAEEVEEEEEPEFCVRVLLMKVIWKLMD